MRCIVPLALVALPLFGVAQDDGFRCLNNNPGELHRHLAETPGAQQHAMEMQAALGARTLTFERGGGDSYIIPVVFHVIHNNGTENIADEQLYDAIRVLNEDFNKLNPDWVTVRPEFLDIVGDIGIEFRLAKRDPEGNCTNGITRTVSTQTNTGDFEMTQLIQWPRDRYLNVWVAASANGAAGYTYYPMWLDGWPEADGIVILNTYTGSIGTSSPYKSRVLSHEVGHWLNLKHAWGDSNEPGLPENCFMDDEVDDTPNTVGWTSCALSGASCGSALDNVQNYMEYSYCCKMFTIGQGDRMIAALTSPVAERENLWQPANLALTGVLEEPQLCMAQFQADHREVCAGGAVQFTDLSYFGVTEHQWSFPGGTPGSSAEEDPVVVYDQPGTYAVSLNVGDGVNTEVVSYAAYITVLPSPGNTVPWSEGFETATALPNADWSVHNPDSDNGFALTNAAAFTDQRSVRLLNNVAQDDRIDALVSSTIDMSEAGEISISFRYAYCRRDPANDDVLYVHVSGDCGEHWTLRKVLRSITTLVTAPPSFSAFVPNGPEQWGYAQLDNISNAFHTPNFRVKFEFVSDGGNNLYLDDINIMNSPVGIEEIARATNALVVAPMPVEGHAEVLFQLEHAGLVQLDILDPLGRAVGIVLNKTALSAGPHRAGFHAGDLAPGTYLLRLQVEGQDQVRRFVVQ